MKLIKMDIQNVDAGGILLGSQVTLLLYLSTDSTVWRYLRRNLRETVALIVTWQVKRMLRGQIDTPL